MPLRDLSKKIYWPETYPTNKCLIIEMNKPSIINTNYLYKMLLPVKRWYCSDNCIPRPLIYRASLTLMCWLPSNRSSRELKRRKGRRSKQATLSEQRSSNHKPLRTRNNDVIDNYLVSISISAFICSKILYFSSLGIQCFLFHVKTPNTTKVIALWRFAS
jgi:hypothetical protein